MGKKRRRAREDSRALDTLGWTKVDEPAHVGFEMDEAGFNELEEIDGNSVNVVETSPGVWEIRPKAEARDSDVAVVSAESQESVDTTASSAATKLSEKQKRLQAVVQERRERKRSRQQERKAAKRATLITATTDDSTHVASTAPRKQKKHKRKAFKPEDITHTSLVRFEKALRKKLKLIADLKRRVKEDGLVPNDEQTAKMQREAELEEQLATCTKQIESSLRNGDRDNTSSSSSLSLSLSSLASGSASEKLRSADSDDGPGWANYGFDHLITRNLLKLKFHSPTEVQHACMPTILHQRRDVIAAAKTGSGKTLAFGLPLVQMIMWRSAEKRQSEPLAALVLTPTRELALQIKAHIDAIAEGTSVTTAAIVGGISEDKQNRLLSRKPDIVIGTCGRLWIHISQGHPHMTQLHRLRFLVLDEADRMLDKGHYAELDRIVLQITRSRADQQVDDADVEDADDIVMAENSRICHGQKHSLAKFKNSQSGGLRERQTLLFSATMMLGAESRRTSKLNHKKSQRNQKKEKSTSNKLRELMGRLGCRGNPAIIDLSQKTTQQGDLVDGAGTSTSSSSSSATTSSGAPKKFSTTTTSLPEGLELNRIECTQEDKDLYVYYFCKLHPGRTIIFANSIAVVRKLTILLQLLDLPVHSLHAQMQQRQRLKNMDRFISLKNCVLVASDIAARGLDVPNVDHVIHYNIARTPEIFIHRSGRTARANTVGLSLCLVSPMVEERRAFHNICRTLGMNRDDIARFEVNLAYMPHVRTRVKLAKRLRCESGKNSQQRADNLWFKQQSEAAEMLLSEDDEEIDGVFRRRETTLEQRLRQELNVMLSQPLIGRGIGGSRKYAHGR